MGVISQVGRKLSQAFRKTASAADVAVGLSVEPDRAAYNAATKDRMSGFLAQLEVCLVHLMRVGRTIAIDSPNYGLGGPLPCFLGFILDGYARENLRESVLAEGLRVEKWDRQPEGPRPSSHSILFEEATQDAMRWLGAMKTDRIFQELLSEVAATSRPASAAYDGLRALTVTRLDEAVAA
jgi:hypothetical protein